MWVSFIPVWLLTLFVSVSGSLMMVTVSKNPSRKTSHAESRVMGGEEARPHSYPWTAKITYSSRIPGHDDIYDYYNPENNRIALTGTLCAGALVHPRFVLTEASYFFHEERNARYTVVLGAHLRDGATVDEDRPSEQVIRVKSVIVHEAYTEHQTHIALHDLALLRLERKAELNSFVSIIALAQPASNYVDKVATFVSWGPLKPEKEDDYYYDVIDFNFPKSLNELEVRVMGKHGVIDLLKTVGEGQFCTYVVGHPDSDGKGFIKMDIGPLMIKDQVTNKWELIGMFTYAHGTIGCFTEVAHYYDWINSKIRQKFR